MELETLTWPTWPIFTFHETGSLVVAICKEICVRPSAENKLKGKHLCVAFPLFSFPSQFTEFINNFTSGSFKRSNHLQEKEKSRPLRTYNSFRFVDGLRINLKFGAK